MSTLHYFTVDLTLLALISKICVTEFIFYVSKTWFQVLGVWGNRISFNWFYEMRWTWCWSRWWAAKYSYARLVLRTIWLVKCSNPKSIKINVIFIVKILLCDPCPPGFSWIALTMLNFPSNSLSFLVFSIDFITIQLCKTKVVLFHKIVSVFNR